ncbi:MAG: hypothetical protein MJH09_08565 [Cetobacterium sp.]|nr:hypothetical protein [Cetobacterium sp.]
MYGKGISKVGEILDIALDNDIVSKSGSWFSFGDIRIGQGKENVKVRLEEDSDLLNTIFAEVEKVIKPVDAEITPEDLIPEEDFQEEIEE